MKTILLILIVAFASCQSNNKFDTLQKQFDSVSKQCDIDEKTGILLLTIKRDSSFVRKRDSLQIIWGHHVKLMDSLNNEIRSTLK